MFDFNKTFKDDSWKNESVIDKCPCFKCEEMKDFDSVQSFEPSEKCGHCKDYILWIPKVIRKLVYLEKESKPNWIPVEDHLPKIDEVVLVQDLFENIFVGKIYDPEKHNGKYGSYFIDIQNHSVTTGVAWMPKPSVYKRGE